MLHHRRPLRDVRTLALDEASRTSAALASLMIVNESGRMPIVTPTRPKEAHTVDADAVLLIGDPAFNFHRDGFAALDLGEAWDLEHSLPFVFAVMVLGPRGHESRLGSVLRWARTRGLESAAEVARSYDSGVDPVRSERYLREVIHYDLGEREKEGLSRFFRLAQVAGLLGDLKELRFDSI
jgi:chorismate dehydratase